MRGGDTSEKISFEAEDDDVNIVGIVKGSEEESPLDGDLYVTRGFRRDDDMGVIIGSG